MAFHYTTIEAFKSIVEKRTLWFTQSEFLNDPDDCRILDDMIKKHLSGNKMANEFCDYISYLHKHISLYVLSMTKKNDDMALWNYYGNGGVQISFNEEKLIQALSKDLVNDDEYISCSDVVYVDSQQDITAISVKSFNQYKLCDRQERDVFDAHKGKVDNGAIYNTEKLDKFVEVFLRGYNESCKYLNNDLAGLFESEQFKCILNNTNNLNGKFFWKKDINLYFTLLSSLLKSSSYKYEEETRLVYFENSVNADKAKKLEYQVKPVQSMQFIKPFVSLKIPDGSINDIIEEITISPLYKNAPIDESIHIRAIESFVKSNGLNKCNVKPSIHQVRW